MEGSQKAREIALTLLEEAKLPEPVVKALLNKATDLGYWRQLNPQLSVGSDARPEAMEQRTLDPPELANIAQKIAKAGYFQAPKILSPRQLGELRSGVERVRDEGWPAVFTFVYDEFWAVLQTPSILRIVESRLGPRFKQNSLIWTYYVPTVDGLGGWPPHTDGRRRHLTIWIPLTDATLDNGCMYVVEHHRVPRELNTDFRDWTVTSQQLREILRATRALPVPAGSVLGWDERAVHWGSISSHASEPRISVAAEFLAADAEPNADEFPLLNIGTLPSFRQRLSIIAKVIDDYQRFETILGRYSEFTRLLQGLVST